MRRRVTIKDIAKAANVTPATVSYVLNDNPNQTISQETREKILRAAADLHYVPNIAAKLLKNRQSNCIGVVIKKNLAVPRFNQTMQGILNVLDTNDYNVLLCANKKKNGIYVDYLNNYFERRIDGIIFLSKDNQGPDEETKKIILENDIPFVAFDSQNANAGYSTVDLDYRRSAAQIAQKMLERCKSRLIYIRPAIISAQESEREIGIREAMLKYPEKELEIHIIPITIEELDAVDKEKYGGRSKAAENISRKITDAMKKVPSLVRNGDVVISSWERWAALIRKQCVGLDIAIGELANSGEVQTSADYFAILPNYEAGQCCAQKVLDRLQQKPPTESVLLPQSVRTNENQTWLWDI